MWTLVLAAAVPTPADARSNSPRLLSSQWVQQRAEQQAQAAATRTLTQAQLAQINRSQGNTERARVTLQMIQLSQAAARSGASALPNIPDGLAAPSGTSLGGLWPYDRIDLDPDSPAAQALSAQGIVWEGADAASQAISPTGQYTVTVAQTQARALLTWRSMNVGSNTTLAFTAKDAAGTVQPGWVAFNRVLSAPRDANGRRDGGGSPTYILGKITADQEIYIVNPNGIIFGRNSTVNVRSLIASALDIGTAQMNILERNNYFLNPDEHLGRVSFSFQFLTDQSLTNGLHTAVGGQAPTFTATVDGDSAGTRVAPYVFAEDAVEGPIIVEPGAQIITSEAAENAPLGRVALIAPTIEMGGEISTPDGQAILAATRNATLFSNDATTLPSSLQGLSLTSPPTVDPDVRGALVRIGSEDPWSVDFPLIPGARITSVTNPFSGVTTTFVTLPTYQGTQETIFTTESSALAYSGSITNTGIVTAARGNITVVGGSIAQNGVLLATTAVNANGSIDITAQDAPFVTITAPARAGQQGTVTADRKPGSVVFGSGSAVAVLPDERLQADGSVQSIPRGSASLFKSSRVRIKTSNGFGEGFFGRGYVPGVTSAFTNPEIYNRANASQGAAAAGTILFDNNAVVKAPGARLSITAAYIPGARDLVDDDSLSEELSPKIIVRDGAAIDVSGIMGLELSVESNLVAVDRVGLNELADSPLQRDGFIFRQPVIIDRRVTGTRDDGTEWVGTPLFDATGFVNNQGLTVEQLMLTGGTINIDGASVVERGANLSVAGGFISYQAGTIATSQLRTIYGGIVDIAAADPNQVYTGFVESSYTESSSRWAESQSFRLAALPRTGEQQAGYLEGYDAGSLTISGYALVDGTIDAGVVQGDYQRAGSRYASTPPKAGRVDFSGNFVQSLVFQRAAANNVPVGFAPGSVLQRSDYLTQVWSTDQLNASGADTLKFGNATVWGTGATAYDSNSGVATQSATIAADARIVMPDGGTFSLTAQHIDVGGGITAHAGNIEFNLSSFEDLADPTRYSPVLDSERYYNEISRSTLTVRRGAVLDVSGRWVNDSGASIGGLVGSDYIDGGSVTVRTTGVNDRGRVPDVSDIVFEAGSLVNLSSGGYVKADGSLAADSRGVPLGRGGDFALLYHPAQSEDSVYGGRPTVVPVDPETIPANYTGRSGGGVAGPPATGVDASAAESFREQLTDTLDLSGSIVAYGFQGGGTFTLRFPEIVIRNDAAGDGALTGTLGRVELPASYFQQGFGAYDLQALLTAEVAPGARIALVQPQYQASVYAATARSIAQAATVGFNQGLQRTPTNLSLSSAGWVSYHVNNVAAHIRFQNATSSFTQFSPWRSQVADNALILHAGSVIQGDPGSSISLAATGQMTIAGSVIAPGGTIDLSQSAGTVLREIGATGGADVADIYHNHDTLFLADTAVLDVSGTTVLDSLLTYRSGKVLAGGSVNIAANNLIARAGSIIKASGTQAVLDFPISGVGSHLLVSNQRFTSSVVTSDGGQIAVAVGSGVRTSQFSSASNATQSMASSGVGLFESTIVARSGGGTSAGGSLSLIAGAVVLAAGRASDADLYSPSFAGPNVPAGRVLPSTYLQQTTVFRTESLADSGLHSLDVAAGVVALSGDVTIDVGREVVFRELEEISVLGRGSLNVVGTNADATAPTAPGTAVIRAPYVAFRGHNTAAFGNKAWEQPGTLTVDAGTIDIGGGVLVQNVEQVSLNSSGDIRFVPVWTPAFQNGTGPIMQASLVSAADITLTAAQVYPTTGVEARIQVALAQSALAGFRQGTTIRFAGNGNAAPVPLSAGGTLTASAGTIIQGGTVRAPLGTITLGVTGSLVTGTVSTERVELLAGSETSVSAAGLQIPYGQTETLTDWIYSEADNSTVSAPPEKAIALDAGEVALDADAVIDLSAGGDLYAYEWIPGLGGSRNVLTTSTTSDASAAIYAIVPGYSSAVAPVDPQGFRLSPRSDGTIPSATDTAFFDIGRTITTTADVPGLPAGTYTLLPAVYATLPGALRVQVVPGTLDTPTGQSYLAPDGTGVVSGWFGYGASSRDSRSQSFYIQTSAVWRQYSDVRDTSANAFFTARAADQRVAPPRLPADAGRLSLTVANNLVVDAIIKFASNGGREGLVDIAAPQLAVLAPGVTTPANFVGVTTEDLGKFNASILIGGTRRSTSAGELITQVADEVLVATTVDQPLTAPELLIVARDRLEIADGSVITAVGEVAGAEPQDLLIGVEDSAASTSGASVSGDGALIRVSAGASVGLTRRNSAGLTGTLVIGDGVVIDGGRSARIDATLDTVLPAGSLVRGEDIDITARRVDILGTGVGVSIDSNALAALTAARTLSIRARDRVTLHQPLTVALASSSGAPSVLTLDTPLLSAAYGGTGAGTVALQASSVVLTNNFDALASAPTVGGATLAVTGETVVLGGADRALSGFNALVATGTSVIRAGTGGESGTLTVPGAVTLDTPSLVATTGSTQTIRAAGGGIVATSTAAPPVTEADDAIGGKLVLDGDSVLLDTTLSARAGIVNFHARTGDVTVGANARILASGFTQTFVDTKRVLAGGRVSLASDRGNVRLNTGALVTVAADPDGNAGSFSVTVDDPAGNGVASLDGQILGAAGGADRTGGVFSLATSSAVDLPSVLGIVETGGFTGGVTVVSGQGDLRVDRDVTADDVTLTADGGRVEVDGTIDASGESGGDVNLFGRDGVTLVNGSEVLARATTDAGRGGQVTIGTRGTGRLVLQAGTVIDVSGGSDYGSDGARVLFRVPYLDQNEQTIGAHAFATTVVGAERTILEPYQTIDIGTAAYNNANINSAARWQAIFDAFTPGTAAPTGANYAGLPNLTVMPGLELVNDDPTVNNGDILISSSLDLVNRRYGSSANLPGILTLRAVGDISVTASISDGFAATNAAQNATPSANLLSSTDTRADSWSYRFVAGSRVGSADPLAVASRATFEQGALANRGNFLYGSLPRLTGTTEATVFGVANVIRTGTGSIDVAAGGVGLQSRVSEFLATSSSERARVEAAGFTIDPTAAIQFLAPNSTLYTAGVNIATEDGFIDAPRTGLKFQPTSRGVQSTRVGVQTTNPAFASKGGDITLSAPNGSIVAQQHFRDVPSAGSNSGTITGQTTPSSAALVYAGQLFTPWLYGQAVGSRNRLNEGIFGGVGVQSARWVQTGSFQQGIAAMGGGDVSLTAGQDIANISVSIVSTYRVTGGTTRGSDPTLVSYGGGTLTIDAGGDINSIVTLVDEGKGTIRAGGSLGSIYNQATAVTDMGRGQPARIDQSIALNSLLFQGDAQISVEARGAIFIDGLGPVQSQGLQTDGRFATSSSNTDTLGLSLGYGADASFDAVAIAGDITYGVTDLSHLSLYGSLFDGFTPVDLQAYLPPAVRLASVRGDVTLRDSMTLAPSPTGTIEALAYGSLYMYQRDASLISDETNNFRRGFIALSAYSAADVLNPLNPDFSLIGAANPELRPILPSSAGGYALDGNDSRQVVNPGNTEPARLIALTGDIVNGNDRDLPGDPTLESYPFQPQTIRYNKPLTVYAGRDLINPSYIGFNPSVASVTSIAAARDIVFDYGAVGTSAPGTPTPLEARGGSFTVGGPGQFHLTSGGSIMLRPSEVDDDGTATAYGVLAVGNRINPGLPYESADITVSFGETFGTDQAAFIRAFIGAIDNGTLVAGPYLAELTAYMKDLLTRIDREQDPFAPDRQLTEQDALEAYLALRPAQQRAFVDQVLFDEVRAVSDPVRFPDQYQDFARLYTAIDTLYPGALGYSDNLSASPQVVRTGNLSMVNAVLRSEYGGDINVLGPGGDMLIGSLASISGLPANAQGLLTLRGGNINAFVDGNFNVFSSRVLTLQGGDVTILSGNGDIDAGRGRRTARFVPPLSVIYDPTTTAARIDFGSSVSGSGIGTVASVPGVPVGNVYLLAPRGDIDAGEAGIRATGNLFVVALQVFNADNIQVGGQSVGVGNQQSTSSVSISTLTTASGAAAEATAGAEQLATGGAAGARGAADRLPSIHTVQVVGFGGGDEPAVEEWQAGR